MSGKVYSVTVSFVADSEEDAERQRADLMDYLVSYAVGELAMVAPIEDVLRCMEENNE